MSGCLISGFRFHVLDLRFLDFEIQNSCFQMFGFLDLMFHMSGFRFQVLDSGLLGFRFLDFRFYISEF